MIDIETIVRNANPVATGGHKPNAGRAQHLAKAIMSGSGVTRTPSKRPTWHRVVAAGVSGVAVATAVTGAVVLLPRFGDESATPAGAPIHTESRPQDTPPSTRAPSSAAPDAAAPWVQITPWDDVETAAPIQTSSSGLRPAQRARIAAGRVLDPTSIDCFVAVDADARIDGIVATGGDPADGCRVALRRLNPVYATASPGVDGEQYKPDLGALDGATSTCVLDSGGLAVFPGSNSCAAVRLATWDGVYSAEHRGLIGISLELRGVGFPGCLKEAEIRRTVTESLARHGMSAWTVVDWMDLPGGGPVYAASDCYAVGSMDAGDRRVLIGPTSTSEVPPVSGMKSPG